MGARGGHAALQDGNLGAKHARRGRRRGVQERWKQGSVCEPGRLFRRLFGRGQFSSPRRGRRRGGAPCRRRARRNRRQHQRRRKFRGVHAPLRQRHQEQTRQGGGAACRGGSHVRARRGCRAPGAQARAPVQTVVRPAHVARLGRRPRPPAGPGGAHGPPGQAPRLCPPVLRGRARLPSCGAARGGDRGAALCQAWPWGRGGASAQHWRGHGDGVWTGRRAAHATQVGGHQADHLRGTGRG
mmetsp:Transcript_3014/g.7354  ORF Transcript_3014/g.7354 Transcript_3014/m.7354 type:complete len:241 (+) Transcript_3014:980-1702(+)